MTAYLSNQNRRILGFLVGAAFGLAYSWVAQFINVWALPGIPLYEPPIGRVGSIVLTALVLGLLGLIVAWDLESLWGLLIAALTGVVLTSFQAYLNSGETQFFKSIIVFVFTFMPRLVFFLPLGLFFRWLTGTLEDALLISRGRLRRLAVAVFALVAVAVIGGRFSLLPEEALISMQKAHGLLVESMSIEDRNALPPELLLVDGFVEYAEGPYTLEWSSEADRLPVTRPHVSLDTLESLVIYRFENGFVFGCVFTPPSYKTACANISRIPPR